MTSKQRIGLKIALGALTLWELLSIYQTLFCAWMTAQPLYDSTEWRTRFYVRVSTAIAVGVMWLLLAIWMFKHRKSAAESTASD